MFRDEEIINYSIYWTDPVSFSFHLCSLIQTKQNVNRHFSASASKIDQQLITDLVTYYEIRYMIVALSSSIELSQIIPKYELRHYTEF